MDKKFITLNELEHYVNFKGKNKNEKVKTFLNNGLQKVLLIEWE